MTETGSGATAPAREPWAYWVAAAVLVVGLLVTGTLVWISASTYQNNENRLLRLRVRDAGALIAERLPSVQTPLASAAALADATDGDVKKFESFIAPSVGPQGVRQYVSVSLWRLGGGGAQPEQLAAVGATPVLAASPARAATFFARTAHTATLSVIGLLQSPQPRLGYAFTSPGLTGRYVAYGETALPASRHRDSRARSRSPTSTTRCTSVARRAPRTCSSPTSDTCRSPDGTRRSRSPSEIPSSPSWSRLGGRSPAPSPSVCPG